jgi:hypothetical protein
MIEDAFHEVGGLVLRQHVVGEIIVFGDAGIVLHYGATTVESVDVRIDAAQTAVSEAARTVAARRGWPPLWLDAQGGAQLPERQSLQVHGAYPSRETLGLRVYVARPECLLAAKLFTCRDSDRADVIRLASALRIKSPTGLNEVFRSFYPRHQPEPISDARRVTFMLEISDVV